MAHTRVHIQAWANKLAQATVVDSSRIDSEELVELENAGASEPVYLLKFSRAPEAFWVALQEGSELEGVRGTMARLWTADGALVAEVAMSDPDLRRSLMGALRDAGKI